MDFLEEKILNDGTVIGTEIIKVDNFLNHQLDVELLEKMGEHFAECFSDCGITKILTVESSGIAVACMTALKMGNLPVVFAKKTIPSTLTDDYYIAKAISFTKGIENNIVVSKKFLNENDKILIIDDFLATGEAAKALIQITREAGAEIVGVGAAIEKSFQGGRTYIEEQGIRVVSLARIKAIENGKVIFE